MATTNLTPLETRRTVIPQPREPQPPSILDVERVVFRHKWKAIFVFGLAILLTILAFVMLPRKYSSVAKLYVRVGHETATLDPTVTSGPMVTVQKSHEREVNSVLQILKSQLIAERVVDSLGEEQILARSSNQGFLAVVKSLWHALDLDPISEREQAILLVKDHMDATVVNGADIVVLTTKCGSPQAAHQLATTVLDEFFKEQGRLARTAGSFEFLEREAELQRMELQRAMAKLRDAKNEHQLLSVEGKRSALNGQVSKLEEQVNQVKADLVFAEARAKTLAVSVAELPETITTQSTSGVANDAADLMRAQLYALEIREKELAAKYGEDHPLRQQVDEQKRKVSAIFQEQPSQRTQMTESLDTTRQSLKLELLTQLAAVDALRRKREELGEQSVQLSQQLVQMNDCEMLLSELEMEVERLRGTYKLYAEREEQARIDMALQEERISSINVIQPPTFTEQPVTPRKIPVLAIGLFLAVVCATGIVVAADYFDSTFATAEQLERQLDLPVLVCIPKAAKQRLSRRLTPTNQLIRG